MKTRKGFKNVLIAVAVCLYFWYAPGIAVAHCDTLEGPVVKEAQTALSSGDVTPVLKWVRKEDEPEIRELFKKTLAVRVKGKEARELADMYFFETLVRIHRAGEGAPYTGLKPGAAVEPSVAAADRALESGSVEELVKLITGTAAQGIRERFVHARETKKHGNESVEAGRKFVAAYVDFTHYAERLHTDAATRHAHHAAPGKTGEEGGHRH